MNKPVASVIITTYGDPKPLARAVRSVLSQTLQNSEVIVVDDNGIGSCWGEITSTVVKELLDDKRVRYIQHEENRNGAAARNTGINATRGEYIAFLDNDDFYLPDKLSRSVCTLQHNDHADAALDDVLLVDSAGRFGKVEISEGALSAKGILLDEVALGTGSNLFFTRRAVEQVGSFDEKFRRNQDIEYMLRFYREFNAVRTEKLGVVKTTDGTCNAGSYMNMKAARQMVYDKFAQEIEQLSPDERNRMLVNDASLLFDLARSGGLEDKMLEELDCLEKLLASSKEAHMTKFKLSLKRNRAVYRVGKALNETRLQISSRKVWRNLDYEVKNQLERLLE